MLKKFRKSELLILIATVIVIFISEYTYVVEDNPMKAIFIGLWPPTIIGFLIYFNIKKGQ